MQKNVKHQVRGHLEGLVHLLTLSPLLWRKEYALLFLLKGAKETGRVFRFGLSSSWLSKLEIIQVCDTSGYSNLRPQTIGGGRRASNLTMKSEWVLRISGELCGFLLFSFSSTREENFPSKHTHRQTDTP